MLVHSLHFRQRDADVGHLLALQGHGVHAILAVQELQHLAPSVANGTVVLDHDVLHRLDQPSLDVARLSSLDGSVDQSLAATHGVEEELLRRQPAQV